MTNKRLSVHELPTSTGGVVNYIVPLGTTVMKDGDRVYATAGDHVHGWRLADGIQLTVYDDKDCPCGIRSMRSSTCPFCRQVVKFDRDGFIASHKRGPAGHRRKCDGSGGSPTMIRFDPAEQ